MERDEILLAFGKMQAAQEETLRRLTEFKEDLKETKQDLQEIRKYVYMAGGFLSMISFSWPFFWDYIKSKMGWNA